MDLSEESVKKKKYKGRLKGSKNKSKNKHVRNKAVYISEITYNRLLSLKEKHSTLLALENVIVKLLDDFEKERTSTIDSECGEDLQLSSSQDLIVVDLTEELNLTPIPKLKSSLDLSMAEFSEDEVNLTPIPQRNSFSFINDNFDADNEVGVTANSQNDLLYVPSPIKEKQQHSMSGIPFHDLNESVIHDQSQTIEELDETFQLNSLPIEESDSDEEDITDDDDILLGPDMDFNLLEDADVENDCDDTASFEYDDLKKYVLTDIECLKRLWNSFGPKKCSQSQCCDIDNENYIDEESIIGSCLTFRRKCVFGHTIASWSSQSQLSRHVNHGDLMLAASILFSGNNFGKIKLMMKFLNVAFMSKTSYYRYQKCYLNSIIENEWSDLQEINIRKLNEGIVLLGDGRMDSPGFNANFCTYTLMTNSSMDIVDMQIIDKREVSLKSTNMEKKGFQRGINSLIEKKIDIQEVVTDEHSQISRLVREEYPNIKHTFDIWHGAKNLAKKISKAAKKKTCKILLVWLRSIVNHFWYVMQTSQSYIEFKAHWKSILHHVTGKHAWVIGDGGTGHCNHGEIHEDEGKVLIIRNSEAHKALRKIIWSKRLLKKVPYFLNFRSTALIENVNELILMYAAKRFGYQYPSYKARCFLAAIDYTHHMNRELMFNNSGEPRLKRKFNKNSNRWTAFQEKVPKSYSYIPRMLKNVIRLHESTKNLGASIGLKEGDPRLLSLTIAPVPPPLTKELALQFRSRFSSGETS